MVWSAVDRSYQYPEHTDPSRRDMDTDLCVYSININGTDIDIFIGHCDTETVPGINTYPIYVTTDIHSFVKIGLFEISSNQSRACLDDTGDVDISRLGNPLLFHSAQKYIRAARPVKVKNHKPVTLGRDHTNDRTIDSPSESTLIKIDATRLGTRLKTVPLQSMKLCEREKAPSPLSSSSHPKTRKNHEPGNRRTSRRRAPVVNRGWFPKRIQSTVLKQLSGEKNSDLLDCVITALNSVAEKPMDPERMTDHMNIIRIAFAEHIASSHEDHFHDLSVIAKSYVRITDDFNLRMDKLSTDSDSMRLQTVSDMRLAREMVQRGRANKRSFDRLKTGIELLDRMAVRVGIFGIASFDQLMDDIASRDVPVNIAFLSMIEELFGVRLVVFVRDEESDIGYWIHSATTTNTTADVHVAMDTKQCQLISYKNNTVFTKETIPWAIRVATMSRLPVVEAIDDIPIGISVSSTVYTCSADAGNEIPGFAMGEHVDLNTYVDDSAMSHPGFTTGSTASPDLSSYISLYMTGSWRAMLSDEWVGDVMHKGKRWESVAHYLVSNDATDEDRYSMYESKFSQDPLRETLKLTGRAVLLTFDKPPNPPNPPTSCEPRRLIPNIPLMKLREKISIGGATHHETYMNP